MTTESRRSTPGEATARGAQGVSSGPRGENPPANEGDKGSIAGLGRRHRATSPLHLHLLKPDRARAPEEEKPPQGEACARDEREAHTPRKTSTDENAEINRT